MGLSQSGMAKLCGMHATQYGEIENLKVYPITKSGWNKAAKTIASIIGIPEEELFPEAFKKIRAKTAHLEIGLAELPYMERLTLSYSPEEILQSKELQGVLEKQMDTLTTRESEILKKRFGFEGNEKTQREVGDEYYIGHERIRQIEGKALRKLRHQSRADFIKKAWEKAPETDNE